MKFSINSIEGVSIAASPMPFDDTCELVSGGTT